MMRTIHTLTAVCALALLACSSTDEPGPVAGRGALLERAYVVNELSDELTVIDLRDLSVARSVATGGSQNHMAEVSADGSRIFVSSSGSDEIVVVDAERLEVVDRIAVGAHPTHLSATPDGALIAVMVEDEGEHGAVEFVDVERHEVLPERITDVATPHFMRFSRDGSTGYVANIRGTFVTEVDMETLTARGRLTLKGVEAGVLDGEDGFADAQVDRDGVLYAAHALTGRVLVHDTTRGRALPELSVGDSPWVAFAEHPFREVVPRHVVPNFGDRTLSLIDGGARQVLEMALDGDEEVYGVNFSSRTPEHAFVMMRRGRRVAVVDLMRSEVDDSIDVGGNVETAATSRDGKFIVAAVSSAGAVVVIDAESRRVVRRFEDVGDYPWSVVIPGGQNYCH